MMESTFYRLDSKDVIISAGGSWDSFAHENKASALSAGEVEGHCFWEYIAGDATVMWLKALFGYVRIRQQAVERNYRCDSPDVKRFMRMHVIPEENGNLFLEHDILSVEPRSKSANFNKLHRQGVDNLIFRCSICNQVYSDGVWGEVESLDKTLNLQELTVAWTVCENCKDLLPNLANVGV